MISSDGLLVLQFSLHGTNLSSTSVAGTESPRPISRIRSDFIAVEKDGRLGLQRNTSCDSSVSAVSTRKLSGDLETPSLSRTTSQDITSAPAETKMERTPMRRTSLKEQPIPESPRTDSVSQMPSLPLPKSPNGKALAPPINPDKTVDEEEVNTKMTVGGPTDKSAVTGNSPVPPKGEATNGTTKEKGKVKGKAVAKEPSKPAANGSKSTAQAVAPVNTASKTATKPTKSPTVTKPLKSPATAAPKLASNPPEKRAAHPEKSMAPGASTSTSKPAVPASGPSSAKKPPPLQPSAAGTGFVKPKVKSPTRPVKLPPGLTTHTAASATKFNVPREGRESRQSLPPAGHDAERRSHSRASISTTGTKTASATAGKNLKRQSSTISRPRPSIGPPPKQASKDHPPTKKEAHVDEGFLARMMRPTAASASKTHEKVPTTPPRKIAAAPVKKAVHKPDMKHAETKHPETKHAKPGAKLVQAAQPAQPAASSSSHAERASPAKKVAPAVEKIATAEEAVEVAKKIDGPAELPVEPKPEENNGQPEEKKEVPGLDKAPQPIEKFDDTFGEVEAVKQAEHEAPSPANPEPEASQHDNSPEQPEAPLESEKSEAAEEAPSEATLVNGLNDKTATVELTEPEAVEVEASKADEGKTAEDSLAKEEVAA